MNQADLQLEKLARMYSQQGKPLRVSFRQLCSQWPWARRSDTFTHLMHRYPAKIFPYIPIFFLSSEKMAGVSETVLDPFAGTGTVLVESIVHPLLKRNCKGVEINPLARLVAKVKTTPIEEIKLEKAAKKLVCEAKSVRCKPDAPNLANLDMWFSRKVQVGLSRIRCCIEGLDDDDLKDFFLVCLSSIIRDVSLADSKIPPPVVLRTENFGSDQDRKKEIENLIKCKKEAEPLRYFKRAIWKNIDRINALNEIEALSSGKIQAKIIWDDARTLKSCSMFGQAKLDKANAVPLAKGSVALAITSPPYINAQKYIRTTKFELLWLNLVNERGIVDLDRKIIGTERIFRGEYEDLTLTNIDSADVAIERIFKKDPKRAMIVTKYFQDMREVVKRISEVVRQDGHLIVAIGDNKICGNIVENHRILSDIVETEGDFETEMVLVDRIRSRGMITKRHRTAGMILDEWVIVLTKK
jgi:hypothetical protein